MESKDGRKAVIAEEEKMLPNISHRDPSASLCSQLTAILFNFDLLSPMIGLATVEDGQLMRTWTFAWLRLQTWRAKIISCNVLKLFLPYFPSCLLTSGFFSKVSFSIFPPRSSPPASNALLSTFQMISQTTYWFNWFIVLSSLQK